MLGMGETVVAVVVGIGEVEEIPPIPGLIPKSPS